ncbi:hypothetical protein [Caballeronia glebae]|uniref:Uncharacterized protein n=1 Tax=Caballeronia glebae TaxID=1777143 RepID=A0A158DL83_9BURK|nr:hypothetical protein [Caballeronia glebae]SAK95233.1 hypothetical protein AWB82_06888 [Caballeronia glebae]
MMKNIKRSSGTGYSVDLVRGGVKFHRNFSYRDLDELRKYAPEWAHEIGKTIFATEAEAIAAARAFRDDVIAQYKARGKSFANEVADARSEAAKVKAEAVDALTEPWLLKLGDRSEDAVRMVEYFVTHEHHKNYRDIMATDNPAFWIARAIDLYRKDYRRTTDTGLEYGCFARAARECGVDSGDGEENVGARVVLTADVRPASERKRGFLARLFGL